MSAVWVPPGQQNFFGQDGKPASLGSVGLYIPNTLTPKLTWADEGQTVSNPAVISLDAAGAAPIWGSGLYRMILKDETGVLIFDKVTGFVSSGGGGGGDVFGPGTSVPGNFAVWASGDGTQIADGGTVGTLAHLSAVNNANWAGTPLSVANGGTGATTGSLALINLGFSTALFSGLGMMLAQGTGITISPVGSTYVIATTGGGGGISGPGSSLNGELVAFSGTSGGVVTNTACVPTANGFSLISAANYAAMRALLSLTSAATTSLGTSGATIPLLSTANTWTLAQTFTLAPVFTDAPGTRTALALGSAALSASTDFEPAGAYSGINLQTGSAYTLVLTDQGKLVKRSNASANTLTIPPHSSVAFPVRARIDLAQTGAGQTSIVAGAGVTIQSSSGKLKLTGQYSGASLVQDESTLDTWLLVGDIAT